MRADVVLVGVVDGAGDRDRLERLRPISILSNGHEVTSSGGFLACVLTGVQGQAVALVWLPPHLSRPTVRPQV